MGKVLDFIKNWMLPLAIMTGIVLAIGLHYCSSVSINGNESATIGGGVAAFENGSTSSEGGVAAFENGFAAFAKGIQPIIVAVMLFLQFVKVSPHDLRIRRYHWALLATQMALFAVTAVAAILLPDGELKVLAECAMLCFICPTAAAAGVITDRLGGSLSETISYVVMMNVVAAVVIPAIVPLVNPSSHISFWQGFGAICMHTFPMLVLPLLLAWCVRYGWRSLQKKLMRYTWWAFYLWGISLTLAIYLATRALINSDISMVTAVEICCVSLAACLLQFLFGRLAGKPSGKVSAITAGQSLGQKNTGFFIWIGYSYLTPVTSIAGGFYSVWQNLVNSYELQEERKHHNPAK